VACWTPGVSMLSISLAMTFFATTAALSAWSSFS